MRRSLAAILLAVAGLAPARDSGHELLVFGAASLTESLQDLGVAFQARSGNPVVFSFGASSDLERQIEAGAPADVFFSADTAKMDALEKAGLVRAADRRQFLSNSLVVVLSSDSTREISAPEDLLALPRIALADPAAVPAGVYAKTWLTGIGLWKRIEPKLVPTLDVRAALAAVESGGVPAAIVYHTDAAISKRVRIAYQVSNGPEILYSVAGLARSRNKAAAGAFVAFLASGEGLADFRSRGFLITGEK